MSVTTGVSLASDMLHRALLEDPRFDGAAMAESCAKSAVMEVIDALAYLYGIPNRAPYVEEFAAAVDNGVPDGLPRIAAMLERAALAFSAAADQHHSRAERPADHP